jgi:hypothetical protein
VVPDALMEVTTLAERGFNSIVNRQSSIVNRLALATCFFKRPKHQLVKPSMKMQKGFKTLVSKPFFLPRFLKRSRLD